ncbi:MAG: GNAT family N-acetyltransferase [Candidatus Pacearchaeota archaeon]
MKIRKARKSDIKGILELEKLDRGRYWKKKDFENAIKNKFAIVLVAEEKNNVLGYINGYFCPTKTSEVMIHETRVNRNLRNKKIGTKLVNEFCKAAFNEGAKEIYAEIDSKLKKFYIGSCKFKKSNNWIEVIKKR